MTIATVAVALFYSVVVRRDPLENAAVTVMGMVWVSLLSFAIIIGAVGPNAVELIFLLVLLTAFFDIAAYFVGRAFGRRPIAPVVSPRKTVEGLVGGVVTTAGLASPSCHDPRLRLHGYRPRDPGGGGRVGVRAARRCGRVRGQAGTRHQGHGLDPSRSRGMIDRIDALLFVVPAGYVLFHLLDYL
jgi:phosphatidate cytidylyltransferase